MSQMLKIVKLMLKDTYRPSRNEKMGGKIAVYVALGILYLFFEVSFVMGLYSISPFVAQSGLLPEFLTSIMWLGLSFVAMLGIMPMLSLLYFSKDSEFFLSLPLSPSKVYFAKLLTVYISQLVLISLIIAPALVSVGVSLSMGAFYYLVMLFAIALLPIFPLMALSIICLPLMYLIRFFKKRGGAASIVSMIFFVVFFFLYMLLVYNYSDMPEAEQGMQSMDFIVESLIPSMHTIYIFPLLAINRFATLTNLGEYGRGVSLLLNFLIFVGTAAVLFFLTLLISKKAYSHAVSFQLENVRKSAGGKTQQEKNGILKALMVREWKELARTPIFVLQCFMGLIIAPIFLIIFGMSDGGLGGQLYSSFDDNSQLYLIWLIIAVFLQVFMSINIGASTAISREGGTFYISKLLPVPFEKQIRAKVLFYNVIYWIDITLCVIINLFITGIQTWWLALLVWAYLIVYNYGFTATCILIDLSRPKLDWKSYREIVKNSRNATLPALLGLALALIMGTLLIYGYITIYALGAGDMAAVTVIAIAIAVAFIVSLIIHSALYSNANKYFERIEA